MRFLERFADPLLLGQVFDPAAFVAAMQKLGLDAVVGVSKDESVTAITPAAAGEFEKVEIALGRRSGRQRRSPLWHKLTGRRRTFRHGCDKRRANLCGW